MLGINPMDVPLYVESFQKKGRLVIDNILETSAAERVGDFLKTMPEDWWFASTLPNRDLNDEMEVHRCDKSNNYYIEKARNAACHALDYNRFSYSFFRDLFLRKFLKRGHIREEGQQVQRTLAR